MKNKLQYYDPIIVVLFSLVINLIFYSFFDSSRDVTPDTTFYLAIAEHLSTEFTYKDPSSPWPDQPSLGRAPVWPFVVSFFIRLAPEYDRDSLIRHVGLLFNLINALGLYYLAKKLFNSRILSVLSGFCYALHPTALFLAEQGLSEIIFVTLVLFGTLSFFSNKRVFAMILLGLSTLVRSNFILFGPLFFIFNLIFTKYFKLQKLLLYCIIFILPATTWIIRNYIVSGHFPVFSSIRGETFYGSHNHETFYTLERFGYWVFPDLIPGETKKVDLVKQYNEYELDKYYYDKGKAYFKDHIKDFPRLLYGKLTRCFIPVPWVADSGTMVVCIYRIVLYLSSLLGVYLLIIQNKQIEYLNLLLSFFICNVVTVILFYGSMRFAFVFEPFLILPSIFYFMNKLKNEAH